MIIVIGKRKNNNKTEKVKVLKIEGSKIVEVVEVKKCEDVKSILRDIKNDF